MTSLKGNNNNWRRELQKLDCKHQDYEPGCDAPSTVLAASPNSSEESWKLGNSYLQSSL